VQKTDRSPLSGSESVSTDRPTPKRSTVLDKSDKFLHQVSAGTANCEMTKEGSDGARWQQQRSVALAGSGARDAATPSAVPCAGHVQKASQKSTQSCLVIPKRGSGGPPPRQCRSPRTWAGWHAQKGRLEPWSSPEAAHTRPKQP